MQSTKLDQEAKNLIQSRSFPCNSLALINDMKTLLEASKTNSLDTLTGKDKKNAQVLVHYLTGQLYGQLYKVDSKKIYRKLNKYFSNS